MEPRQLDPNLKDFHRTATELLAESCHSIATKCCQDMQAAYSVQLDLGAITYEFTAVLGSILLHEIHSKRTAGTDINDSYESLKNSLAQITDQQPELPKYAVMFDNEQFHTLLACYFNGQLAGFNFHPDELQETTALSALESPDTPGIEAIFFALITRLFKLTNITQIKANSAPEKPSQRIIRLAETGIAAFAFQLPKLRS